MIDSNYLRDNPAEVLDNLKSRGYDLDIDKFQKLDQTKRSLQQTAEELQAK